MNLDFNVSIAPRKISYRGEYREMIDQFIESDAPSAEVKLSVGKNPAYTAAYFSRLIKDSGYPVMVIRRSGHVYLVRGVSDAE